MCFDFHFSIDENQCWITAVLGWELTARSVIKIQVSACWAVDAWAAVRGHLVDTVS